MGRANDVSNGMLVETVTVDANDFVVGFSARNERSRVWRISSLTEYFRSQIGVAAIELNLVTNTFVVTNGDGSTVNGTVTT